MKKLLTDAYVKALSPPKTGRVEISDVRCAGLVLRVTAADARSWSYRFRDPTTGKVARATIGQYPTVGLSDARSKSDDMRRDVAAGVNPSERKRRKRVEGPGRTFEALATRYLVEHARRKKRTADADERNLKIHVLPTWRDRPCDQISRSDVIELVEGLIAAGTPVQANRVHALISTVFSFGMDVSLVTANPCTRLRKRGTERVGNRVLSDDEIRLFWNKIVHSPVSRRSGLGLRLALLTGARIGEIAGIRRAEFEYLTDESKAAWIIPASRVKNKREHLVPLSAPTRTIVLELLELIEDEQQFLFPAANRSSASRPVDGHSFTVATRRFGDELKGPNPTVRSWKADKPTPHDLRRTVETRLSELGIPKEDRDAVLNHVRSDIGSKHYDRYERRAEKRRVLEIWASALLSILSADVVAPISLVRKVAP